MSYPCSYPLEQLYVVPRKFLDLRFCSYHHSVPFEDQTPLWTQGLPLLDELFRTNPELATRRQRFLAGDFKGAGCCEDCLYYARWKTTGKGVDLSPTARDPEALHLRRMWLSVGPDCNIRCRYCLDLDHFEVDFKTCNPAVMNIARDLVRRGGHLLLTGGETFLPKWGFAGVLEELAAAEGHCGTIGLHTNGTYLNPRNRDLLLRGPVTEVGISMDTLRPELFKYLRQGASFDLVWGNARQLLRERNAAGHQRPSVVILCAVMKSTWGHLTETIDRVVSEGLGISLNALFRAHYSPDFCDQEGLHNLTVTELECLVRDLSQIESRFGPTRLVSYAGFRGQVLNLLDNARQHGGRRQVVLGGSGHATRKPVRCVFDPTGLQLDPDQKQVPTPLNFKLARWTERRSQLAATLQSGSQSVSVLGELAALENDLGNTQAALNRCEEALTLEPHNAQILRQTALIALKLGQTSLAQTAVLRLTEVAPEAPETAKLSARLRLAESRPKDAIHALAKVRRDQPHDLEVLMILAKAYVQLPAYTTAETLYERILDRAPDNRLAADNLDLLRRIMAGSAQAPFTPPPSPVPQPAPQPASPLPAGTPAPFALSDHDLRILKLVGKGRVLISSPDALALAVLLEEGGAEAHIVLSPQSPAVLPTLVPPTRQCRGALPSLPCPAEAFDTVLIDEGADPLGPIEFETLLREADRLARSGLLWHVSAPPIDTPSSWGTLPRRTWCEQQLIAHGWRKHPLSLPFASFEALEDSAAARLLWYEKVPAKAQEQFPADWLAAERDLHMDMAREPGIRSEAHLARYALAREWVREGMVVLDAACGLGYGAAMLACQTGAARVHAVDISGFAIEYARAHYGAGQPTLTYHEADVAQLSFLADASVDLVATFETLEHLQDPEVFLDEINRVLKPGGVVIASVPNRWVDEKGCNPIPWHFQVYDVTCFQQQIEPRFTGEVLYRQNAGGGWKRPQPRLFRRLPTLAPTDEDQRDAEWWILVARKPDAPAPALLSPPANRPRRLVVLDETTRHRDLFGAAFDLLGIHPEAGGNRPADEVLSTKPDLILLSREWSYDWRLCAAAARRARIPVVYVMDGVLEWSYVWNNLSYVRGEGTVLQPLFASDLCVIGQHPARILAGLGLAPRIHIVGLPRCESLERTRVVRTHDRPRVVISTARTSGHNVEHRLQVFRALRDLQAWFSRNRCAEPVWRIAPELAEELGVLAHSQGTFPDLLREADALVSFPSTCVLEGMLLGLPVAQIEYRPVPLYVSSAWEIRSGEQIPVVLHQLLYPAPERLAYQDACLSDELEPGSASQRLAAVIRAALVRPDPYASTATPPLSRVRGRLDYHQVHTELSAFALAPESLLAYELDAAFAVQKRLRQERDVLRRQLESAQSLTASQAQAIESAQNLTASQAHAIESAQNLSSSQAQTIADLDCLARERQATIEQLDKLARERQDTINRLDGLLRKDAAPPSASSAPGTRGRR